MVPAELAAEQQLVFTLEDVHCTECADALDLKTLAQYPPADIGIERIGDLQAYTLADLLRNATTEIKR